MKSNAKNGESPLLTAEQLNRVYDGFYEQVIKIDLQVGRASRAAVLALTNNGDFIGRLIGEGKRRLPQTPNELRAAIKKVEKVTLGSLMTSTESSRSELRNGEKQEARAYVIMAFKETLTLANSAAPSRNFNRGKSCAAPDVKAG